MGDRKGFHGGGQIFGREEDLLKLMMPNDEPEDIAVTLSNLNLKPEDEADLVTYGPLGQPFYTVNCPFVWTEYVTSESIEWRITDFEEKVESDDMEWKAFCYSLYLAFLYARLGKLSKALDQLEACEKRLQESSDDFYDEIMDGMTHSIEASRAHIYFLKGDSETADDVIAKVFPLKDLNNPSKGALIALNAAVLQVFSRECREMALKMMHTAIKLDPDEEGKRRGGWYYTVGKLMGQLRRMDHRVEIPSKEELKMLERSTKVNPLAVSLAALADAYREAISSLRYDSTVQVSEELSTKMLSEAKELYQKAFELDSQNCATLRRCGNGLMKLPHPYKDIVLAKKCLEKAIAVNPKSSSTYQALGTMEDRYNRNPRAALKYYELAFENGNNISAIFVLEARMKVNRNYNPLPDIDEYLETLAEVEDMAAEFAVLKGEYLFFQRNDLLAAIKFWKEAILLKPNSEIVMKHMTRFITGRRINKPYLKSIPGRYVFNVYELLRYEIRNALRGPKLTGEEVNVLKEMAKLCESHG
ncbi:uncharacterized protein LOC124161591 [Ischnura elegans]|uniref:uncharacterized protein LOC124161591 n=1 Tax=Ischnura elegans TaxID=197161 RepID=UPI001ED8759D|nr:uncharacterized protein LOC124161591 [Ischnura elegans]XP_046393929.1 uncharacterized protein LOC124161591 [Ischnura elegans]